MGAQQCRGLKSLQESVVDSVKSLVDDRRGSDEGRQSEPDLSSDGFSLILQGEKIRGIVGESGFVGGQRGLETVISWDVLRSERAADQRGSGRERAIGQRSWVESARRMSSLAVQGSSGCQIAVVSGLSGKRSSELDDLERISGVVAERSEDVVGVDCRWAKNVRFDVAGESGWVLGFDELGDGRIDGVEIVKSERCGAENPPSESVTQEPETSVPSKNVEGRQVGSNVEAGQ